jgi:hypothetical protein
MRFASFCLAVILASTGPVLAQANCPAGTTGGPETYPPPGAIAQTIITLA